MLNAISWLFPKEWSASDLLLFLQTKLATTDDSAWKEREAAVLALGAVAEGCITGLYPHLPEVIFFDLYTFN